MLEKKIHENLDFAICLNSNNCSIKMQTNHIEKNMTYLLATPKEHSKFMTFFLNMILRGEENGKQPTNK